MRHVKWFSLLFVILIGLWVPQAYALDGDTYIDPNGVTYTEFDGKYTITGYNGVGIEINIPEVVNGKFVNKVGFRAFYGKSDIVYISLPSTIVEIEGSAFSGCSSLLSVNIPEGVTGIASGTFFGCSSLTTLSLPDGVTYLGISAFEGCSALESITIPNSVKYFERATYSGESRTFYGCSNLVKINIPDGVTSVGKYAFYGCSSLKSISLPNGFLEIADYTFSGCNSLENISIPDGVTNIGSDAFSGCSSLSAIDIPDSVVGIGASAFRECRSLTSIIIPDNVTSINWGTFINCSSLTSIKLPDALTGTLTNTFVNCSSLTDINIPEGVSQIGDSTFSGCSSLTNINIPDGVTRIGSRAFYKCTSLTAVSIPEGVMGIGSSAFEGCNSLTSIIIPDTVKSLGWSAFEDCKNLNNIIIPYGLTNISRSLLFYCSSLTNIYIPNTVTTIESFAFGNCLSLSSITLPASVTSIDQDAFGSLSLRVKTIVGYKGSYAETYANDKGITFVPIETVQFSVQFETNTVEPIDNMIVQGGEYLTNLPSLEKEDYVFAGWYRDPLFINIFDITISPVESDMTLYAKWVIPITFDSMGGLPTPEKVELLSPGLVPYPIQPSKQYYIFNGWYMDKEYTDEWQFDVDIAMKGMTLYAKWLPQTYTVHFSSRYGEPITPIEVEYNTYIMEPEKPSQIGYHFIGWYKDAGLTQLWDFVTDKVTSDITLYAKWSFSEETIFGSNRYQTSVEVSKKGFEKADVVVIANGSDYPDALAGVPLAHTLNAPLLLTTKSYIPNYVMDEIYRLGASNVIILGLEGAIDSSVEMNLMHSGFFTERLGGANRYETAAKVAKKIVSITGSDSAFIASGLSFADALSVGPIAAINRMPILLTGSRTNPAVLKDTIQEMMFSNLNVVGGTGVVNEVLYDELDSLPTVASVTRYGGKNRFETGVILAEAFLDKVDGISVAYGLDFPDALAGGVYSAKKGVPLLLVNTTGQLSSAITGYLERNPAQYAIFYGGEGVLPVDVRTRIIELLN